MMRALFLLVAALFALEAFAAVPSVTCTPTVTSGTEPLGVLIDCSATTDADTSKPFHDLLFETTFGDRSATNWENGVNTSASKNHMMGPIVAHVYQSCTGSPFTAVTTVTDGTSLVRVENTITVACANTTYNTAATKCFYQTSASSDCPNGGAETNNADFDNALSGCVGTTKRCLFQCGSTFAASANTNVSSAGPITIGSYGPCTGSNRPIVNVASGKIGIALNNAAVNDLRIMDIEFVGTGVNDASGLESGVSLSGASVSGVTILRVISRDMGGAGILFAAGSAPNFRSVTNTIIQDSELYNNFGGEALFIRMISSAVLGNLIGPVAASGGQFPLRVQRQQKSVIAHNTIKDAPATKEVVSMRADLHSTTNEDSFYSVFRANKVMQGTRVNALVRYVNNTGDDRIYDMIAEGNWILMEAYTGGTTCKGFTAGGVRVTFRNNLIDMSAPTTCIRHGIEIARAGTEPAPDDVNAYNNTFFSSATLTTRGVDIVSTASNTIVKNNVCWFDVASTGTCVRDNGTGSTAPAQPTAGGNSSDAQTTGTDPSFDGPSTTPSGFRVSTGSYAASGGVAIFPASNDDFLHCDDTTSNERLGAFVPRARTKCKGSAGP